MTHFAGKAARVFLLAGLTTVALAISSLAAPLPADEGTITGSSVRMRSGASTSTSILTVMDKGTVVTVLGKANDDWYNISYKGMTGCVSADYLKLLPRQEIVPVPEATPESAPTTPVPSAELPIAVGTITGSSVRMRAGASTSTSILKVMDKGTVVSVLGKANDDWYGISCNGKTGYVSGDYLKVTEGAFTAYGRIAEDSVYVRSAPSGESDAVTTLSKSAALTITDLTDGWYSVTSVDGSKGYVRGDLVTMDASARYDFIIVNPTGNAQAVVDLAKQFLGVRYVYGGSDPKKFDCSGFTMYVCKQLGVSLPHSATSQWLSGKGVQIKSISAMQPGDLVFFCDPTRSDGKACSHCGIYLGNNQFIHASSSKAKVVISDLSSGYYNRYYVGGLRIF